MTREEEIKQLLKTDPFIKYWGTNYKINLENKVFNWEHSRPLIFLKNKMPYGQKPMVLVAAGPSLDNNIQYLKDFQNKCIICCVDILLFKLLENGIKPDYVLNIDPHPELTSGWRDLMGSWYDASGVTLVCPTTANYESISEWRGDIIFYNQTDHRWNHKGPFLDKLTKTTEGFGDLENNYFIGATMVQFAHLFSPSVTILTGYDFAYTDDKPYCSGVIERKAAYQLDYTTDSTSKIEHTKALTDLVINSHNLIAKYGNKDIKTTNLLKLYMETLTKIVKKYNMLVINSTEGGIYNEVPRRQLKDTLESYCKEEIKKFTLRDMAAIKRPKRRKR